MRFRSRRVFVKARVVKLYGARSIGALRAHLRYLERDGASREGARSPSYSTFSDEADGKKFLERSEGDRHQFRFIVSPDDGGSFDSLHAFTRELVARMEQDLDTILDWIAVDHFDTGHPHTHVLMRGETEEGKILQIAGNYIAGGIRARGSQIMTGWLGPQSEMEVREQQSREIGAERLTKLDQDLLAQADDGFVDLKQSVNNGGDYQQMLMLSAGTIISASLITGLDSDLPGTVIAQVSENVCDSATGRTVLIPRGAKLIGRYDAAVSFGEKRILLVWEKIVFPGGASVELDKMPATDAGGHAGLEDGVDFHEWRLVKGVALATLLGLGNGLSFGGDSDIARAIRETGQQNGTRAGEQIVAKNLDVQPTLTVRPGWPVRAIVQQDLVLKPWTV